jgi:hypothetical protein
MSVQEIFKAMLVKLGKTTFAIIIIQYAAWIFTFFA